MPIAAAVCTRPIPSDDPGSKAIFADFDAARGRSPPSSFSGPATPPAVDAGCGGGRHMTVHFYDVGEALAALVDLPDGRHILIDTGDSPLRAGCGEPCARAQRHLGDRLRTDLGHSPIDLMWITHQHADHIGGVPFMLDALVAGVYVDNGRDASKPEVRRAHRAAERRGVTVRIVDPGHSSLPMTATGDVRLAAVLPLAWPASCARDPNDCSIGLRIDFCSSSALFTGDAEHDEEASLDTHGPATLLQVAHHGSETSTTPGFLSRVKPRYAVISAGKPGEGLNRGSCHPRALVVQRLTRVLGGPTTKTIEAFDGERCDRARPSDWAPVPSSDRLWATARDGDVVLTTAGDGTFHREAP